MEEEHREMLQIVHKSATSLLDILNDILDLSKIESEALVLEKIPFSLDEVISRVSDGLAPMASEKGLMFSCNYLSDNVPSFIVGDPLRLGRILINIVGNAIKYTVDGAVDMSVDYRLVSENRAEIIFIVKDTGIGIAEKNMDLIFDKFAQADVSTTRSFGGTGLGLAITKQLVSMMDGKITVDSEIGEGSCFTAIIPFMIAHEDSLVEGGRPVLSEIKKEKNRILAKDVHLLVAEDHPLNLVFIEKLLRRIGIMSYDLIENGKDALSAYKENSYDLLLTDCHMPQKNGYDLTRDIRELENGKGKHLPIVAMTANAMVGDREKCLQCGMDDYVSKPISRSELVGILSRWIIFSDEERNIDKFVGVSEKEDMSDAPVDLAFLDEYAEGDKDIAHEYVKIFISQSEAGIKEMGNNCVDGENMIWADAAHKLKGGAAMIGADELRSLCEKAQYMENATAQERAEIFKDMESAFNDARVFLEGIAKTI